MSPSLILIPAENLYVKSARARDVLASRVWTALPPDADKGVVRPLCVVLSRADATVLVEAPSTETSQSGRRTCFLAV